MFHASTNLFLNRNGLWLMLRFYITNQNLILFKKTMFTTFFSHCNVNYVHPMIIIFNYCMIISSTLFLLHWLKIKNRIIYTILMLTYKSYYYIAPPYLCELINKKVMWILGWELIMCISSVYSTFSDGVGLPLHNIPSSWVLVKSIEANCFITEFPSWRQPQAISNSSKCNSLAGTQPIQLYKLLLCTISTQNSIINLCCKLPFSRILWHTWVKAVMLFYSYITRSKILNITLVE